MRTAYYLLRYIYFLITHKFKKLGWRVGFSEGVILKNSQFISIGNRVFIGHQAFLQIPDEALIRAKTTPKLVIGDHVTIGFGTKINSAHFIRIEDHVLIAPLVYITDHDHRYDDVNKPIKYQGITKETAVRIKSGAWIGTKVTITAGVTIGKNAVIGAHSLVTKDIPDFAVAVGTPAKVIKKYDNKTKKWVSVR